MKSNATFFTVRERSGPAYASSGQGNMNKVVELISSAQREEVPTILLGDIAVSADLGEQALLAAGVEVYQYSGILVRPILEKITATNGYKSSVVRLQEVDAVYLRDLLARHAIFHQYRSREKEWVRKDPPIDIAKTILGRAGEWHFPVIVGVVTTPTMRPDGSLLTRPGYDPETQLLLVGPPEMPTIPPNPSRQDALESLASLEGLLTEFPLADDVSKSVALSALITPVARGAFPVAPMHVCTAPAAGSGKSYLLDVAASIAIGQLMPVMAAGRNEEETEKRLGAALMAGQPLISIDNVTNGLGGDALCIAIERSSVRMRILGLSENARVEARGTTFFATGNNITVLGDMCRRVVTSVLDPEIERPELRMFRKDPVAMVMSDRGAYVAAALTICRAYVAAGRPQPAKRLASFEGWSDTVRSALVWLGKADPVASMERARELDPHTVELRAMLEAWSGAVGMGAQHSCTCAQAIDTADNNPEFLEALETVTKQKLTAGSLGAWLQRRRGTVVDRKRFAVESNKKGGSKWWVEEV
jgi:putative DNA primase/helicase